MFKDVPGYVTSTYLWRVGLGGAADVAGLRARDGCAVGEVLLLPLLDGKLFGQEVVACNDGICLVYYFRGVLGKVQHLIHTPREL